MTVTLSSPATIFELADLAGAMSRVHWSVAKSLARKSSTYAFRAVPDGEKTVDPETGQPLGELIALAGLSPVALEGGGLVTELWFCPGPNAGPHVGGITRLAKLTLANSPYRGIYTICRSEAGKRFARVLGFLPAGSSELGEIWAYGHADRQGREGSAEGAGRRGGEPAAAIAGTNDGRTGDARPA